MKRELIIITFLLLSACQNQNPQSTQSNYVSPNEFKKYNCAQIYKDLEITQSYITEQQGKMLAQIGIGTYLGANGYGFANDGNNMGYYEARMRALEIAGAGKGC